VKSWTRENFLFMARARDYQRKNYSNPFSRKSKSGSATRGRGFYYGRRSKSGSLRRKLVIFFLLAATGGWIYFLFYSPYFWIQRIEFSGLEKISEAEIRDIINSQTASRRFLIFQQKNIFLFDEKFALKNINQKYALESIKFDKKLPETLRIEIKEEMPALIWRSGEKYYDMNRGGLIIRELLPGEITQLSTKPSEAKIPVVYDESNEAINIKDVVLSDTLIQFGIDLYEGLPEKTGIRVLNFKVANRKDAEIKALTNEGWEIYFSSDQNLTLQTEKLYLFLKDKKEDQRKALGYIDLRFEDRVYYK